MTTEAVAPSAMDDAALQDLLNQPDETEETDTGAQEEEGTPAESAEAQTEEQETDETQGQQKGEEEVQTPELTPEQKAEKQLKDKEAFIQRQAEEIGRLRKLAQQREEELAAFNQNNEIDDLYHDNPTEAVNKVLEAREKAAELQRIQRSARILETEKVVVETLPDFNEYIDEMGEILKSYNFKPDQIAEFKRNPYVNGPVELIALATAAKHSAENRKLKQEVESLRKKPEQVLKSIEKAAKTVVTGATGKAGGSPMSGKQIHQMSNAQLDELLNSPDED